MYTQKKLRKDRTHGAWWALTWGRPEFPGWNVVVYSIKAGKRRKLSEWYSFSKIVPKHFVFDKLSGKENRLKFNIVFTWLHTHSQELDFYSRFCFACPPPPPPPPLWLKSWIRHWLFTEQSVSNVSNTIQKTSVIFKLFKTKLFTASHSSVVYIEAVLTSNQSPVWPAKIFQSFIDTVVCKRCFSQSFRHQSTSCAKIHTKAVLCKDISIVSGRTTVWDVAT